MQSSQWRTARITKLEAKIVRLHSKHPRCQITYTDYLLPRVGLVLNHSITHSSHTHVNFVPNLHFT